MRNILCAQRATSASSPRRAKRQGGAPGLCARTAFRLCDESISPSADDETVERLDLVGRDALHAARQDLRGGSRRMRWPRFWQSPRFLFREERTEIKRPGEGSYPAPVTPTFLSADSWTSTRWLSRLSYFLWSSMPDAELFRLAAAGELRKNLNGPSEANVSGFGGPTHWSRISPDNGSGARHRNRGNRRARGARPR